MAPPTKCPKDAASYDQPFDEPEVQQDVTTVLVGTQKQRTAHELCSLAVVSCGRPLVQWLLDSSAQKLSTFSLSLHQWSHLRFSQSSVTLNFVGQVAQSLAI